MPIRKNLALLVAASPMTTRPIYINGELYGVYDSAYEAPPPMPAEKPSRVTKRYTKKSSKEVEKSLKKTQHRYPCIILPTKTPSNPFNYKCHKLIPEESIRKIASFAGVEPEPCAFDTTRDAIVDKIRQVMRELQLISELTGKSVMTHRDIGLALRCIDKKLFGRPCIEPGILDTLRELVLMNDV